MLCMSCLKPCPARCAWPACHHTSSPPGRWNPSNYVPTPSTPGAPPTPVDPTDPTSWIDPSGTPAEVCMARRMPQPREAIWWQPGGRLCRWQADGPRPDSTAAAAATNAHVIHAWHTGLPRAGSRDMQAACSEVRQLALTSSNCWPNSQCNGWFSGDQWSGDEIECHVCNSEYQLKWGCLGGAPRRRSRLAWTRSAAAACSRPAARNPSATWP